MDSAALAAAASEAAADYDLPVRQIGQWRLVWRRFKRHRLAVAGGIIVLLMVALALIGPYFAPPFVPLVNGAPPLWATKQANMSPNLTNWRFLMGSDGQGNGVITYVLLGGRPLLLIGVLGAVIASFLGGFVGSLAGYLGGVIDAVLMRIVDAFLAIPLLLLLILFSTQLPDRSTFKFSLLFGLVAWAGVARLVRGYILALREREFAEAARALGVSSWGIILRHLLPNALDVLVVSFTLNIAVFIVTEVTLDFLHAGTADVTWGSPLADAFQALLFNNWWVSAFPAIPIVITVIGFNFLGDGLRDALDATGTSALMSDPEPYRQRPAGKLQKIALSGFHVAATAWHAAAGGAEAVRTRARIVAAAIPVPAPLRALVDESHTSEHRTFPIALRIGPLVLVALASGFAVLYGHSPLVYSANYGAPTSYAAIYGSQEYGSIPRKTGGWGVLIVDNHGHLVFGRIGAGGSLAVKRTLGPGDGSTRPSLAHSRHATLGAWIGDQGQIVYVELLSRSGSRPVPLVPPGGIVQNPYAVGVPGGFDVLFGWQPSPKSAEFDLYLASISGTGRVRGVKILLRSGNDARYIRAAEDGSGHLDAMYLKSFGPGQWNLLFQRFTASGAAVSRPQHLGVMNYFVPGSNGCNLPNVVPDQWAIDMRRATDGSVWAAWETGVDCVTRSGISGANTLWIGHWSSTGSALLPPTTVDAGVDASAQAVGLSIQAHGGYLYYPQPGSVNTYLVGRKFDLSGNVGPVTRVDYQGGANVAQPRAATLAGRPQLLWEQVRADGAELAGTAWHPKTGPDLITHLGLNIGNLWGNLALIIFGALGGAIALALINVYLLVPLILIWPVLRRVVPLVRWTGFIAVIAAILAWVFAAQPAVPDYVLVITTFGYPVAWMVVAGAVFTSAWVGHFLFGRQESGMRATAVALIGLYFVSVMYAIMYIEAQLGQI